MKMNDLTATHPVIDCPACGQTIEADVTIEVTAHFGGIASDGRTVEVKAEPKIVRFHVRHNCQGRGEAVAAPEYPGCIADDCPQTMAACKRHCSSCGGDVETTEGCQRNPITGESGHTWSTGLPQANR